MEKLNIGEKNSNLLSDAIAQIVNFYSKNNKIDCIYMRSYVIKNYLSQPVQNCDSLNIRISLLYNDYIYEKDICKLDRLIKIIKEKTNINLIINFRDNYGYNINMEDSSEYIACRDLYNSKILFDRTGYFTNLQQSLFNYAEELNTKITTNIELIPPLTLIKQ